MLGVESGSFGWTLVEGTAHVICGAASGAGEEAAVVLGTLVLTRDEALSMPAEEMAGMDMEATPEP